MPTLGSVKPFHRASYSARMEMVYRTAFSEFASPLQGKKNERKISTGEIQFLGLTQTSEMSNISLITCKRDVVPKADRNRGEGGFVCLSNFNLPAGRTT